MHLHCVYLRRLTTTDYHHGKQSCTTDGNQMAFSHRRPTVIMISRS